MEWKRTFDESSSEGDNDEVIKSGSINSNQLKETMQAMTMEEALEVDNINELSPENRLKLYRL